MKRQLILFAALLGACFSTAIAQPTISLSADTVKVSLSVCDGSTTSSFDIINSGTVGLNYNLYSGLYKPSGTKDSAYVVNRYNNNVSIFDLTTHTFTGTNIAVGSGPRHARLRPDGSELYVSNFDANSVTIIRTSDNTVLSTISVGTSPTGIDFTQDGNFAYVGNRGSNNISKIDCNTMTVVSTITGTFDDPQEIRITNDGRFALVACRNGGVSVMEIGVDTLFAQISSSWEGDHFITFSPDGSKAYVSRTWSPDIIEIDLTTMLITQTITDGSFSSIHGLEITPDGKYLYAVDRYNSRLIQVDLSTYTIQYLYDSRFDRCWDIDIESAGKYAYLSYENDASIGMVVLNLATNTIETTVAGGSGARGLGFLSGGLKWLDISPVAGTVSTGSAVSISLTFDGNGMATGTHYGKVFAFSDDPAQPVDTLIVELTIAGAPVLALSDSCLYFDTTVVNGINNQNVTVYNSGCDTMFITNIVADLSEYTSNILMDTILAYDSLQLVISFNPTAVGIYPGLLTITNNAGDTTVCLNGVCIPPPIMTSSPDSLLITINSCDDSMTVPLMVYNTGAGDLEYILEGDYSLYLTGGDYLTATDPTAFNFNDFTYSAWVNSDNTAGWRTIVDLNNDLQLLAINNGMWAIWGRCGYVNIAPATLGWHHVVWTVNGVNWEVYVDGISIGSGTSCSASVTGNIIAIGAGSDGSELWSGNMNNVSVWSVGMNVTEVNSIMNNGVVGTEAGLVGYWPMNEGSGMLTADLSITNAPAIFSGSPTWVDAIPWLNDEQSSGTIVSGDSVQIDLEFFSTDLLNGVYTNQLVLSGNDPLNPSTTIPIQFTVNGQAAIALSTSCLNMDTIMEFATTSETLMVYNTGCDTLFITNIASVLGEYTANVSAVSIAPYDSVPVIVSFSPLAVGNFPDNLTLTTNIGNSVVCLTGVATASPTIVVTPTSLALNLTCGASDTLELVVENTGVADLIYEIEGSGSGTIELLTLTYGVDYGGEYANTIAAINSVYTNYNLTEINTTVAATLQAALVGKDVFLIPEQENGSSAVFSGFATVLQNFCNNGGTVIFCGTSNASNAHMFNTGLFSGSYNGNISGSTINNVNPTHDITQNVPASFSSSNATFYCSLTNPDKIQHVTYAGSFDIVTSRPVGSGNAIFIAYDFFSYNIEAATLIANAVEWGGNGVIAPWITITQQLDTLVTNETDTVAVVFNSTGLSAGVYPANIIFVSNDPQTPSDTISTVLTVSGFADIALSDSCLVFDSIMEFNTTSDSMWITNTGCDTLKITSISAGSQFTASYQFSQQIAAGEDDSEEYEGNQSNYNADTYLDMGTNGLQLLAFRFRDLDLPQGATISSAYLDMRSITNNSSQTDLTIQCENTDSSSAFTNTSADISSRPLTSAVVNWNSVPSITTNVNFQTPDLSAIVQEVLDRPGWNAGNALSFVIDGTGYRACYAYDNNPAYATTLVIEYETPSFNIMPGDSAMVSVEFAPSNAGDITDNLSITNNAGDTIVCLTGYAFPKPLITANPDTFNVFLGCGDSIIDSLWIFNTGVGDLIFDATVDQGGITGFESLIPLSAGCIPQTTGTCCGMGIYNVSFGSIDNTTLQAIEGYQDYSNTILTAVSPGQTYPISITTGTSYQEHVRAWIDYNNDGTFDDATERVFTTVSVMTNHTGNVTIPTNAVSNKPLRMRIGSEYYFNAQPSPCGPVVYGQYEDYTVIISDLVALTNPIDTVLSGDSSLVGVTIYSSNLVVGTYNMSISVNSNDPLSPTVTIPTILTVTGASSIAISDTCLIADTTMEFTTSDDTLWIYNTGCDTLWTTAFTSTSSVFYANEDSLMIEPGDSLPVYITFAPLDTGLFTANITIVNNDIDTTICLSGYAYARPTMLVDPDSLSLTVQCADSVTVPVWVYNTGESDMFLTQIMSDSAMTTLNQFTTYTITDATTIHSYTGMGTSDSMYLTITINGDFDNASEYCELYIDGTFIEQIVDNNVSNGIDIVSNYTFGGAQLAGWLSDGQIDITMDNSPGVNLIGNNTHASQMSINQIFPLQPWLSATPTQDTIVAGDSLLVNYIFDSYGLTVGTYTDLVVYYSNDPINSPLSWPVELIVQGAPTIGFAAGCMTIDSVMEYTTGVDTFQIINTGCDTLFITDANNTLNTFSLSDTSGYILPGDTTDIFATFSPTVAGNYVDTFVINNNDVDTFMCITGMSYPRPIVTIIPDTFNVTIVGCNDSIMDSLMVVNTGLTDLTYTIVGGSFPPLQTVLNNMNSDFANVTSEVPNMYSFIDGIIGNSINDGGNDMYDQGNYLNTDLGLQINYSDNAILQNAAFGVNGQYFTRKYTGLFMMAADIDDVAYFELTGGMGADGSGNVDGTVLNTNMYNIGYTGYVKRIYNAGDPSVNQMIIIPNNPTASHNFSTNTDDNQHRLTGIQNTTRIYYLLFASASGGFIDNTAMRNIMDAFLNSVGTSIVPWMNINPAADTVIYNDTSVVAVQFNGNGLTVGTYTTSLLVNTNDPLNSQVIVPVTMNIVGAPYIGLVETCVAVDTTMELSMETDSFHIFNSGCDTLFITDANNASSAFSLSDTSGYLLPGDTTTVIIYFTPSDTGFFQDTFMISNNDIDTSICVSGYAYERPEIMLNPDTVVASITACCDSITIPVAILNIGGSDLYINNITGDTAIFNFNQNTVFTGSGTSTTHSYTNLEMADSITVSILVNGDYDSGSEYVEVYIDGTLIELILDGNPSNGTDITASYSFGGTQVDNWLTDGQIDITLDNSPDVDAFVGTEYHQSTLTIAQSGGTMAPWITATPTIGTVAAGDSSLISFKFNAGCMLTPGQYNEHVVVHTNDPVTPAIYLPIIFTVDSLPSAPIAEDKEACFAAVIPDLTASGSADSIIWYSDAALLTQVNVGTSYATGQTAVGTYTYWLTQYKDSCEGLADSVNLFINAAPITPTALDTSSCDGTPVPSLTANGSFVTWYDDAALTNVVGTGSPYISGLTAIGSHTLYVTDSTGGCVPSIPDTSTINIYPIPGVPMASDTLACFGYPTPDLISTGTFPIWYSDPGLSNEVGTGSPFPTGETAAGTYTYYVVDSANGCEGIPDTAVMIIDITVAPIANDTSSCEGSPVPDLTAAGTALQWYSDAGLTTLVGSGTTLVTGQTNAGIHTYYVTQSIGLCESPATIVNLTIYGIPAAPMGQDTSACVGGTIPSITATGTNIVWYSDGTLLAQVGLGTSHNTGMTAVGSYDYYATQAIGGCVGVADTITLTILPAPVAPNGQDSFACVGASIPDLSAVGTNLTWYGDGALTTEVGTGLTLATGETAAGIYTYYVTDSIAGCEGPPDTVSLTIYAPPTTPIVADITACEGTTIADFVGGGVYNQWYGDGALTIPLANGTTYNSGTTAPGTYTYYVTDSTYGCPESTADTITLVINTMPATPVVANKAICFGEPTPTINTIAGDSISWYADGGLTTLINYGDTLTQIDVAIGTHTYYVTETNLITGCASYSDTVTLSITVPTSPIGIDTTICVGGTVPDMTASGSNLVWYSDGALTTQVGTGTSYTTNETAVGTYNYYVTQDPTTGCESLADTATLIIGPMPNPTAANLAICFGEVTPQFTANGGNNIQWFADAGMTTLLAMDTFLLPTASAAGIYTYYFRDSLGACISAIDSVTLTISAAPNQPSVADQAICDGDGNPIFTTAGSNVQWYSDGALTVLEGAGNNFTSTETAVGSYTYYVADSITGCQGEADTLVFTINGIPPAANVSDILVCVGAQLPPLTASSNSTHWYTDGTLTNEIAVTDTFNTGLSLAGTYAYYATDSVNGCYGPVDTVTVVINDQPGMDLSVVCIDFDSIVETTTASDSLTLTNMGCDTLDITNIASVLNEFAVSSTNFFVPPASSITIAVNFTPLASGIYTDTLTISTNLGDTTVCLAGIGLGAPVISTSTDTINVAFNGCCDSSTTDIMIYNTGQSNLYTTSIGDSSWVSMEESQDTIAVNDSTVLTININGCDLVPGVHTNYVLIANNDPISMVDTVVVIITKGALPATPAGADTSICDGSFVPDLIATGVDSVRWYTDEALTNLVHVGDTFPTNQTLVNSYTYYITVIVDSCESLMDSVTLQINAPPVAPILTGTVACSADAIGSLIADGSFVNWYTDSAATVMVGSGLQFDAGISAAGSYTFYATDSVGGCATSPVDSTILLINPTPNAPSLTDTNICYGSTVPEMVAAGSNITWYYSGALDSIIGTNDTLVTGADTIGSFMFWATETVLATGCVSNADSVALSIVAPPVPPSSSDTAICYGNSIPLLIANGQNIQWYDDALLTNMIYSGDTLIWTDSTVNDYIFYITDSSDFCAQSVPDTIVLSIKSNSVTPIASDTTICFGMLTPFLTTTGTNIQWYSANEPDSVISTNDTLITGLSAAGTYVYYVTDSLEGCPESIADTVTLQIEVTPIAPASSDITVCEDVAIPDFTSNGVFVTWYNDTNAVLGIGNNFATGIDSVGGYTFYLSQVDTNLNGCMSEMDTVVLTINAIPNAPIASNEEACEGSSIPPLWASGTNIQWYNDSTLGSFIIANDSLNTGASTDSVYTYYTTQTSLGCESPATTVTLSIFNTPTAPFTTDAEGCEDGTIGDLTATGTNVNWYSDAGLTTIVNTGNTYATGLNTANSYVFYVTDSLPNCLSNTATATLIIGAMPNTPIGTDVIACANDAVIPPLTATGSNTQWYGDATIINKVGSGNSFDPGKTMVGTYLYYITDLVVGCPETSTDTVSLTINPNPLVTLNTYNTTINAGGTVELIAYNANNYVWTPAADLSIATGSTVWASPMSTVNITVTGTTNGCSTDASVKVVVSGDPTSIDVLGSANDISVYPNPTLDKFTVTFGAIGSDMVLMEMTNALGQVLQSKQVTPIQGRYAQEFFVEEYASGVYFMIVRTEQRIFTKRIVIE